MQVYISTGLLKVLETKKEIQIQDILGFYNSGAHDHVSQVVDFALCCSMFSLPGPIQYTLNIPELKLFILCSPSPYVILVILVIHSKVENVSNFDENCINSYIHSWKSMLPTKQKTTPSKRKLIKIDDTPFQNGPFSGSMLIFAGIIMVNEGWGWNPLVFLTCQNPGDSYREGGTRRVYTNHEDQISSKDSCRKMR